MNDCIFCKIISGEVSDIILGETDDLIVILSLEGHPLIIPKRHIETVYELEPDLAAQIMREAVTFSKAVKETTGCTGLNLVQSNGRDAGQEVFHFHMHIKPRWENDDVVFSWHDSAMEQDKRQAISAKFANYFDK